MRKEAILQVSSDVNPLSPDEVLDLVPQQKPFRFIDEIVELDANHIIGKYTFREDEVFYEGHFPGNPVTPGVILTEAMAQTGVVALGIYILSQTQAKSELRQWTTFFTDSQMEFFKPVFPGESVIVKAEKVFYRRMKLKSAVRMYVNDELVAEGTVAGMGVKLES